ncbi:MAG: GlsB/YeaQ/YmgE family stress response membrane protein [Burkholderiales bacterium]|nr:GlsB/YeaQ/YmgE family stress response membrane protein [Burkholderiales bacterium]
MALLWTIVVGFVVGLIARAIMPGRQVMGIIMTTLLGVGGAVVAGFAGQLLGIYRMGEPAGFVGAIVGAFVLLFIYDRLRR